MIHTVAMLLAAGLLSVAPAQSQSATPALSGAIYQNISGTSTNSAFVAALAYLHDADLTTNSDWIGPVLTDPYGRFAFYNVPRGHYLLRIYDADNFRLWEQVVSVPSTLQPIIVRDITITYYPKDVDGSAVDRVLESSGYPYKKLDAVNKLPTNTVWFGDAVPTEDVKIVALALIKAGVKLKGVYRFENGSGPKAKIIEVGSTPAFVKRPTLQISAIQAARDFPRAP